MSIDTASYVSSPSSTNVNLVNTLQKKEDLMPHMDEEYGGAVKEAENSMLQMLHGLPFPENPKFPRLEAYVNAIQNERDDQYEKGLLSEQEDAAIRELLWDIGSIITARSYPNKFSERSEHWGLYLDETSGKYLDVNENSVIYKALVTLLGDSTLAMPLQIKKQGIKIDSLEERFLASLNSRLRNSSVSTLEEAKHFYTKRMVSLRQRISRESTSEAIDKLDRMLEKCKTRLKYVQLLIDTKCHFNGLPKANKMIPHGINTLSEIKKLVKGLRELALHANPNASYLYMTLDIKPISNEDLLSKLAKLEESSALLKRIPRCEQVGEDEGVDSYE